MVDHATLTGKPDQPRLDQDDFQENVWSFDHHTFYTLQVDRDSQQDTILYI